jgi:serine/threonine-protein kinase
MVAGKAPFVGDTPVAVTYQHVHAMPTPLHDLKADVSLDFEAIVAKCMAKSPKRRYESASALRDDIRRSINREPVRALDVVKPRVETAPTTAIPVLIPDSLPPLEDDFDDSIPGRTAAYVFGAVFLALLLIGAGVFVFRALTNTTSDNIAVPSVVNLPLAEASQILLDLGLTPIPNAVPVDGVDDDIVYQQDPPATAFVREGDVVTITYNPASQRATVPPIQGLLVKDATALLAPLGLQLTISEVRNDPTIPINQIIAQDPIAGTEVRSGSAVSVVVSGGAGDLVVPNVEGQLASAATQLLTTAPYNFVVTTVDEVSETVEVGRVLRTEPEIGSPIGNGAPITLVVSKGSNRVAVPQVEGLTDAEAQSALSIAGLTWDVRFQNVPENDPSAGRVISQSPRAGENVAPGSKVSLVVGRSTAPVSAP